jgi:MFS family permease
LAADPGGVHDAQALGIHTIVLGFFLFWINGDNYAAAPLLISMAGDFGVDITVAAWSVVSYMLCFGLFTIIFGPLGDRFGKTTVLKIAAAGSAVAGLASSFAPHFIIIIAIRAVNGAFSAGVMPVALAFIGETSIP